MDHTQQQHASISPSGISSSSNSNSVPSSAKTPLATTPTPLFHTAMYDQSGQPVYIIHQGMNSQSGGPAIIPLQLQQPSIPVASYTSQGAHTTLTNSVHVPTVTIPSSLKLDQSGKGGLPTMATPPPGTPKSITVTQTFTPPSLEGLIQPKLPLIQLPHTNGGQQMSEVGPIRSHSRQAARERPSPVAFDGEHVWFMYCLMILVGWPVIHCWDGNPQPTNH